MHEHNVCEHEIKYCKVCDACYCEKCKKQWLCFTMSYGSTYPQTWGDGIVYTPLNVPADNEIKVTCHDHEG